LGEFIANTDYEKLDRILMATEWEEKYPLLNIIPLTHDISGHTN